MCVPNHTASKYWTTAVIEHAINVDRQLLSSDGESCGITENSRAMPSNVFIRWILQKNVNCGLTFIITWTRHVIWRYWIVMMIALTLRTVKPSIVFYVAVALFPVQILEMLDCFALISANAHFGMGMCLLWMCKM